MTTRRRFPGISPLAWQHPGDLEATEALKRLPGIDQGVKALSEHLLETAFLVDSVGSRIRVGPRQAPKLWNLHREACEILDDSPVPQLFLTTQPEANAFAFGMKEFTIIVHSGLTELMTEEELLAVLGHELSHIKAQHMLYKTLGMLISQLGSGMLGIGALAALPLRLALLAWSRRAEISSDRAALLVVQDPLAVGRSLAKLAGMSKSLIEQLDMEEVYKQAEEYEKTFDEKISTRAFKMLNAIQATHPAAVWRAKLIADWAKSEQYRAILAGDYLKQGQQPAKPAPSATAAAHPCPACAHKLEPIFSFCPACGVSVDEALVPCYSCGKKVEEGWETCPHCHGPTAAPKSRKKSAR